MELFKQSMGFVLLLVAVWLLSTLAQRDATRSGCWRSRGAGLLPVDVGHVGPLRRAAAAASCRARGWPPPWSIAAGFWMLTPPRPLAVRFEPFDQARIDAALQG